MFKVIAECEDKNYGGVFESMTEEKAFAMFNARGITPKKITITPLSKDEMRMWALNHTNTTAFNSLPLSEKMAFYKKYELMR